MNIITRGLGVIQSLVTRGFGKYVAIVVLEKKEQSGFPVEERIDISKLFLDKDLIKTKRIKIPISKRKLNVDAYLLHVEQLKNIRVIVEALGIESYELLFPGQVELLED